MIAKPSKAAHIGGSACGYQAIFVPSTALASPGYDGQPAVYLYIAALEVNVLNCRRERDQMSRICARVCPSGGRAADVVVAGHAVSRMQ